MTHRSDAGHAGAPPPAWLPSGLDQQFLAVALFDDDRAAQAWERLRPELDLDEVNWDQHRLLPLVERGLRRAGVHDPDLPRLKGIHRQTWSRNQLLLNRTAPALGALAGAGIPTMVLKGGALGLRYYDDLGLRPMADLDVLVPFDLAVAATDVLIELGYESRPLTRTHQLDHHGRPAAQPDGGGQIDLHWQLNMAMGRSGPPDRWSDDFWAAAVDLDVAGHATQMPCPADLLLHVCVHGAGWSSGRGCAGWPTPPPWWPGPAPPWTGIGSSTRPSIAGWCWPVARRWATWPTPSRWRFPPTCCAGCAPPRRRGATSSCTGS